MKEFLDLCIFSREFFCSNLSRRQLFLRPFSLRILQTLLPKNAKGQLWKNLGGGCNLICWKILRHGKTQHLEDKTSSKTTPKFCTMFKISVVTILDNETCVEVWGQAILPRKLRMIRIRGQIGKSHHLRSPQKNRCNVHCHPFDEDRTIKTPERQPKNTFITCSRSLLWLPLSWRKKNNWKYTLQETDSWNHL